MSAQNPSSTFEDPFDSLYDAASFDAEFNQNWRGINSGPGKIAQWFGAWDQDEYNRFLTNQDRAYERAATSSARAWDEYMDSTKYQRMVKDLEAAGLNPYLALQGGLSAGSSSSTASQGSSARQITDSGKKQSNKLSSLAMLMIATAKLLALL